MDIARTNRAADENRTRWKAIVPVQGVIDFPIVKSFYQHSFDSPKSFKVRHGLHVPKTVPSKHQHVEIDLFHIVFAHAYISHVTRYFSIIGETLQRWGKRILSH